MDKNRIGLVDAAHKLHVDYGQLWRRVVTGAVPAAKTGTRWTVARADLPAIARTLGADDGADR